jgi:hypothetical protein
MDACCSFSPVRSGATLSPLYQPSDPVYGVGLESRSSGVAESMFIVCG